MPEDSLHDVGQTSVCIPARLQEIYDQTNGREGKNYRRPETETDPADEDWRTKYEDI
jgi:hypothetical protein